MVRYIPVMDDLGYTVFWMTHSAALDSVTSWATLRVPIRFDDV